LDLPTTVITIRNWEKREMLYSISTSFLRKELGLTAKLDSDDLREKCMRMKKNEIHSILYKFLEQRIANSYKLFISERQEVTTIDDITILSKWLRL
jgi:transcription initiation factor IIE alpha subunit